MFNQRIDACAKPCDTACPFIFHTATPQINCPLSEKRKTCNWPLGGGELMQTYHDREWGVPVWDDQVQFEFLTLESAQAGLSWLTVLKKREAYRKAFAEFDPEKVARFHFRDPAVGECCGRRTGQHHADMLDRTVVAAERFPDIGGPAPAGFVSCATDRHAAERHGFEPAFVEMRDFVGLFESFQNDFDFVAHVSLRVRQ